MTGSVEMDEVVGLLQARLKHLLKKETRIGSSTPNRKDRIKEEELTDRLLALRDHHSNFMKEFATIKSQIAQLLSPDAPEFVEMLTPTEIQEFWADDREEVGIRRSDLAEFAVALERADHTVRTSVYELSRIIDGHLGNKSRSHGLSKRRSREVAAWLLGYAEGMGLSTTGDQEHGGRGSSVEAIARAVRGTHVPRHETARLILRDLPKTFDGIRDLARECRKDEPLDSYRSAGCMRAKSDRTHQ